VMLCFSYNTPNFDVYYSFNTLNCDIMSLFKYSELRTFFYIGIYLEHSLTSENMLDLPISSNESNKLNEKISEA